MGFITIFVSLAVLVFLIVLRLSGKNVFNVKKA